MTMTNYKYQEIAIIGMAGRFPGANNIGTLWDNLKAAKESISFFNTEELEKVDQELLENPLYVKAHGILKSIKRFDAKFFGYSPREAEIMDPQHRIFLECAWEALENAGYSPNSQSKNNIGVYAGVGESKYLTKHIIPTLKNSNIVNDFQLIINNSKDFLSTRVAYKLNLTGPAMTIQTACSTSLVVVHQACIALQMEECEMALAGAVSFLNLEKTGYLYQPGMILSPDGKCRAFDAHAQGTVGGQGVGVIVLKPAIKAIEDRDHIYAIVKSSAINNDGSEKIGFTAPSIEQQAKVINSTYQKAGILSETITYIEAHGTGTILGDPVEIEALTKGFDSNEKQFCALGSIKTNLGHLDTAAGIAGLIKTVLCLYHKTLVPSLHYTIPNPQINFKNTPFYVNTELKYWQCGATPRRAGVSSFGVGGTNAHILLEEPPQRPLIQSAPELQLISFSADRKFALDKFTKNLSSYLLDDNPLKDIAYTLHIGRKRFKYNRFIICQNREEAITKLKTKFNEYILKLDRKLIFMFPGEGTQYIGMGSDLYKHDQVFKSIVDKSLTIIRDLIQTNLTLDDLLGLTELVEQTIVTQPALFIIEYSLAQYLIRLGIKPDAMIGYGIGEYVAACISGVLKLEDALRLVIIRGQILQNLPKGKMLSVFLSENQVLSHLKDYNLDIAAINTGNSCVISGSSQELEKFAEVLDNNQIPYRYLNTSHAFHSRMLDPILNIFYSHLSQVTMNMPTIPYVSNLTGDWIDKNQVTKPEYWVEHLRKTVLFAKGLDCLLNNNKLENTIFLEIGPGEILTNLVRKRINQNNNTLAFSLLRSTTLPESDKGSLLSALGNLYAAGVNIKWSSFYNHEARRVPLPTYPFDETEYWIPSQLNNTYKAERLNSSIESEKRNKSGLIKDSYTQVNLQESYSFLQKEITKIWQDTLGVSNISYLDDFFELGGDSLQAIQINNTINTRFKLNIPLKDILENSNFSKLSSMIQSRIELLEKAPIKNTISTSTIIKLKDGKKSNPLFVIHPISGYVFCYRYMLEYISPTQLVFGIQSPWIEGNEDTSLLTTIEALASYYVNSIISLPTTECISLFGSSFGGLVAYEIAQQLKSKNYKVSLLAMADVGRPNHELLKVTDVQEMLIKVIKLFKQNSLLKLDYVHLSKNEKVRLLLESMNLQNLLVNQQQQLFDQVNTFCQAMINYQPKPYYGKVIFFDANIPVLDNHFLKASSTWDGFVLHHSEIYTIAGNHFSMLEKPNVSSLVYLLEECIYRLAQV